MKRRRDDAASVESGDIVMPGADAAATCLSSCAATHANEAAAATAAAVGKATTATDLHHAFAGENLPTKPAAFVVNGLLSAVECTRLIDWGAARGWSFGWGDEDPNAAKRRNFRSAHTVEFDDPTLASAIWQRLKVCIQPSVSVDGVLAGDMSSGGKWLASGIHSKFMLVQYREGGHFSPHSDGFLVVGAHERTLYTCLIYLNDLVDGGGETDLLVQQEELPSEEFSGSGSGESSSSGGGGGGSIFVQDEKGRFRARAGLLRTVHSQRPKQGNALCFFQTTLHEGTPVHDRTVKYMLRADVLFKRAPASIPPTFAAADDAAFQMLQRAEALEATSMNQSAAAEVHLEGQNQFAAIDETSKQRARALSAFSSSISAGATTEAVASQPKSKRSWLLEQRWAEAKKLRATGMVRSPLVAAMFGGSIEHAAAAAALWRTR